jgi:hypothetical protein
MSDINESQGGRFKTLPNNVSESALIEQIRIRPLLYDKKRKEYRKVRSLSIKIKRIFNSFINSIAWCI